MKLGLKGFIKRGQKGLTLVELMVVMAILAVLASIVFPAVSGTQEVSVDSQTKQDASTVSNAATDFFADQTGAEVMTSNTTSILTATVISNVAQQISSRWPEEYLQMAYSEEFPTTNVTSVAEVVLWEDVDKDGEMDVAEVIAPKDLAEDYNALDLVILSGNSTDSRNGNYIPAIPKSSGDLSTLGSRSYNNYLWLVEKTTASGGVALGSRAVVVFKLTGVERAEVTTEAPLGLDTLTYKRIY